MWKAVYYRKQAQTCLAIARMLSDKQRSEQFALAATRFFQKAEQAEGEAGPQTAE